MTQVFGIDFASTRRSELVDTIANWPIPRGDGPRPVFTANLDHVVQLHRQEAFRDSYNRAWVATADGMPVYLYAKLRGAACSERLTGADLFRDLMSALSPEQHRCFFVVNAERTGRELVAALRKRGFQGRNLTYFVPPFGFDRDLACSIELARRVVAHRTTHLFLGVGSPRSEIWTHQHYDRLGDCYVLCVGAALEFYTGARKRAPEWMQHTGFEWLWRCAQEPRRLFRRYFVNSWQFAGAVMEDLKSNPPVPAATARGKGDA